MNINPYAKGAASGAYEQGVKTAADYGEVTSQLDRKAQSIPTLQTATLQSKTVGGSRRRIPLVTFIDDDARANFPDKWNSIIAAKNIPVSCAIVTGNVGVSGKDTMSWDTIAAESALGVEMLMHSHMHVDFTTLSDTQIISDITAAKSAMRKHGYMDDVLVYPFNSNTLAQRKLLREYVRCGIGGISGLASSINTPPINTMNLYRYGLTANTTAENPSIATLRGYVDAAVSGNGWLILMSHSYQDGFDSAMQQTILDLIDYCGSVNASIVNVHRAIEIIGNQIECNLSVHDVSEDAFVVDADGYSYAGRAFPRYIKQEAKFNGSTTPRDFEYGVTISYVYNNHASGTPTYIGGFIITYKNTETTLSCQHYFNPITGAHFIRGCDTLDAWRVWIPVSATPAYTTALRPTTAYVGMTIFDSTLGKPIWCKSIAPIVWVDGTGTVV